MTDQLWERLATWAGTTAGLDLSARQQAQLADYVNALLFWNSRIALISVAGADELVSRHIADSLFAAAHCRKGAAVADLGSGPGLPGIPIAIAHPESRVCLMESRGKKASFLAEAARLSDVRNVRVFHGRIERAAVDSDHTGRYRVAIARALTRTRELLALARPLLGEGGRIIAMKSVREELPAGERGETIDYELPDGTPRRLLVMARRAVPSPGRSSAIE